MDAPKPRPRLRFGKNAPLPTPDERRTAAEDKHDWAAMLKDALDG